MLFSFLLLVLMALSCQPAVSETVPVSEEDPTLDTVPKEPSPLFSIPIHYDVPISCYFEVMDTLVHRYDSLTPYPLSEHLLVRSNSWIIDSLVNTDYYRQIERGVFVYDQKEMVILKKGDTLLVPAVEKADQLLEEMALTVIDVNIPEYTLRILQGSDSLYTFPVRVGQNRRKFLSTAKREVDLQTRPGQGHIIRVETNPYFVDPASGKRFTHTRRDDGKTTLMPQIPWIEPELDGQRYGQLIHPTTNPKTLRKAYSNGCVGTREGDAWRIYYYAPVGTKVVFRYDLQIKNEKGDTITLPDIYGFGHKLNYASTGFNPFHQALPTMSHELGCPF